MAHDEELEDAMEEDVEEVDPDDEMHPFYNPYQARKRNLDTIRAFLGSGKQTQIPIVLPRYYGDLLAWALQRYIERDGWKVVKAIGTYGLTPSYTNVSTSCDEYENVLSRGSLLLLKEDSRIVTTIKAEDPRPPASLVVASCRKKEARKFADGVESIAKGPNLYGGKKLEFGGRIRFLSLSPKSWEDLILAPALKNEIEANTVGFLNRRAKLATYGIPPRRGVILVGEPGTGKTLISKILMSRSPGITCIVAHQSGLEHSRYIYELYNLAEDLKPSIVFIEDIDLVGEKRGEGLFSLLSALDGVEECRDIVTVASTNFLEVIDKALTERPSRFDRIIQLPPPSLEQRSELIRSLSQKIPMDENIQDYLARRTEHYTPAQVQEAAYSLVIDQGHSLDCDEPGGHEFGMTDVDNVLAKISRRTRELGFKRLGNSGNGSGVEAVSCSTVGL